MVLLQLPYVPGTYTLCKKEAVPVGENMNL